MHLYFVAAEPSGDVLASEVIQKISITHPDTSFSGVGGSQMASLGITSLFDTKELAVFGLLEGIKAFKTVKARVEDTARDIVQKNPDAIVLVDSWGFMWRVAQRAKQLGYAGKRIKLIGPQVWATRAGRAKTLAAHVDHLLCIHDFEETFYRPHGLDTTVIGNPALERDSIGNGAAFRKSHAITEKDTLLLLLLGSRNSEIKTVAPVLIETANELCKRNSDVKVICVAADSVKDQISELSKTWQFPHALTTNNDEKLDAFAACDVALACSGTVTTEVALQNVPLVIGYKVGWVTWAIARLFLMKAKYITLLNVAADKEVAKEFIQTRFTTKRLLAALNSLLNSDEARHQQIEEQNKALEQMGRGGEGASSISARKIVELASK